MRAADGEPGTQTAGRERALIRRRLSCRGAVQGVGFRPAVWRLATGLGLAGVVRNDADGACVEVEGAPERVALFTDRLPRALPPLARLARIETEDLDPLAETSFRVEASRLGPRGRALLPPDAALCPTCRAELDDPRDRRWRYPFTTCTDCGPRFTLARRLPYDRERTSMAPFPLCARCAAEYADPASRRFHAEPVCCPSCGPRLWAADAQGRARAEGPQALAAARDALSRGRTVALRGLGGFQLACRADREAAVARLRSLKRRPTKPFALMARDLAHARALVELRRSDEELLAGARGPILLAPRRAGAGVAPSVAPGIEDLGVLLPTTPLHVELFRGTPFDALVMTSGNRGDEPICRTNEEALERLAGLADLFLLHEREVVRRADDSVVRAMPGGHALVRRSRGWAPEPVPLSLATPEPVLALGGHLQSTACLAVGEEAFPSQHVGDLDSDVAREFLHEVARGLEELLEVRCAVLAVDEHPDYASTWLGELLARTRGGRVRRVQHHLAHAAAVLAEHGRFPAPGERTLALVLDGTGFGMDGTAWGAECLLVEGGLSWRRLGHAAALPLVGGERAVREPWRVLCAALVLEGESALLGRLPLARALPGRLLSRVVALVGTGGWPLASGAGRVFEAAGALLCDCVENRWEGEAAARLEGLAAGAPGAVPPWPEVARRAGAPLPTAALLAAAARRLLAGEERARIAAGFHASFARLAAELVREVAPAGLARVALGGGCLINRLLSRALADELGARGLEPLFPRLLPPGDGGLAYGQAVLASAALARRSELRFEGGS